MKTHGWAFCHLSFGISAFLCIFLFFFGSYLNYSYLCERKDFSMIGNAKIN